MTDVRASLVRSGEQARSIDFIARLNRDFTRASVAEKREPVRRV